MKYIKLFEDVDYSIDNIKNWWNGINVIDLDDRYVIDLDIYLANKIIQLNNGLHNMTVNFYCLNHMVNHEVKIRHVMYWSNELRFKTFDGVVHIVDTKREISIPKIWIDVKKYNL